MRNDADDYDELVGMVYEASVESTQWDEPFGLLLKLIDGAGFHLLGWDSQTQTSPFSAVSDSWRDFIGGYHQGWGKLDPHMRATTADPVGKWLVSHQQFDARFVSRDSYYQDFLMPNGVRHLLGTSLVRGSGIDVVCAVGRPVGVAPFSDDAIALVRRFTPHLQRAVKLHIRTADLRQRVAIGEMALQAMDSGVVALNANGEVVFANQFAEKMLQAGSCLKTCAGRVTASDAAQQVSLRVALKRAASTRHPELIRVQDKSTRVDDSCLVNIVPVSPANRIGAGFFRPDLLLLVSHPKQRPAGTPQDFMKLFNLTPAEGRLAAGIATGQDLDAYAQKARVGKSTVRSHLKSIFHKTGTRRQQELVRLLSQVALARLPED